jgi:hyperosmotically inducible periplasmic protein
VRCMFRLAMIGALLAGGAYLFGYRWDDVAEGRLRDAGARASSAASGLAENIDRERIREAGAGIARTVGAQAGRAETVLDAAKLTAKIKAKMALDDTIEARRINIDTVGTVVTLRGSVASTTQRQRVLQLARETEGVSSVVDRILVAEP